MKFSSSRNWRHAPNRSPVRSWIQALLILVPLGSLSLSCGGPESDPGIPTPSGMSLPAAPVASPHPYPDVHGGEVHGDKNFANLINNYSTAKFESETTTRGRVPCDVPRRGR